MCRMAAILSCDPFDPAELLADGERSLLAQADAVKGREQGDGWGTAHYRSGEKIRIHKSRKPVWLEKAGFRQAVSGLQPGLTIAHIRKAPGPEGLPAKGPAGTADCQPYGGNGFIFSHNGTLEIAAEIRTTLGKYENFVKSTNDSEVLFWQLMKMLDAYGDPALALEMAMKEINTVWLSVKGRYPGKKSPCRGLNILLSDGRALWTLCHYPDAEKKDALLTPGWGFGRMAWKKDARKIIFASEPLDAGQWRKMADMEIAEARLTNTGLTLRIKNIL